MPQPKAPLPRALFRSLPPARAAALTALSGSFSGTDIQAALDEALTRRASGASPALGPADAALATTLAYGTLRLRIRLEWLLGQFFQNRKKSPLPDGARLILLLATYELTMLDRVPAYATVSWAVEAIKTAYGRGLAGMANAVLRRVAELGPAARDPEWYAARLSGNAWLAAFHSVPEWLVDLWIADYGEGPARARLAALLLPPVPAVRVNSARPGWTALRDRLVSESQGEAVGRSGVLFRDGLPDEAHALARSGDLTFQGAGSQAILEQYNSAPWFSPVPGLQSGPWPGPIWDACAGRGGKTLALLEQGLPIRLASDPDPRRLRGLLADARRLGLTPPPLARAKADQPPLLLPEKHPGAAFGTILIDAPCSGLGTLTRRPDILLRRTPADLADLAALQKNILAACFAQLRPGGYLAYITCTASRQENEGQIQAFLSTQSAALEFMDSTPLAANLGENFFCALLRRR